MNIVGATLLTANEINLINDVLDFRIFRNPLCFRDYDFKLEIEIKPGRKNVPGNPIDLTEVQTALDKAKKELEIVKDRYYELEKQFQQSHDPVVGDAVQSAEREWGVISNRVRSLMELINGAKGKFYQPIRELLGEFVNDPTPKIILYLGSYADINTRYKELIPVFVHEMFHAMNFFVGNGKRTIREIDEAMAEFATGVFLCAAGKSNPVFDILYARHKEVVLEKANDVGESACYGFGRYLMDNVASKSRHSEIEWIESYAEKSARIDVSLQEVQDVINSLYPFYPTGAEATIMNLFERIIFARALSLSVASTLTKKTGLLKVTRRDGSVIQMNTSASTFVLAILEAGIRRVYDLRIPAFGGFLVDDTINPKSEYAATQYYEPISGLYILKHSNTLGKKRNLERISDKLGLGWTVEIV